MNTPPLSWPQRDRDGKTVPAWFEGSSALLVAPLGQRALLQLTDDGERAELIGYAGRRQLDPDGQAALNHRLDEDLAALEGALALGPTLVDGLLVELVRGYLCYAAFDLLCYDGEDLGDRPLLERAELLAQLWSELGPALSPDWYVVAPLLGREPLAISRKPSAAGPAPKGWWRSLRLLDDRLAGQTSWIAIDEPPF